MSEQVLTDSFFDNFDLHPSLLAGLHESGFTRCTPIQALTLPVALAGRDVAGQAQTGTGKTGAFLIAAMQRLLTQPALAERKETDPRCLVLAPTRELAIQIDKDFKNLGRHTGLKSALIYGGVDYDKQREQLRGGVDIIIATPGRLIDYFKQHVFALRAVDVMVIDEADRMFDLGFIKDVRFLMRRLPPRDKRLGLLFSATLSYRVLELAYEHMNNPEKLSAETESVTASRVRQSVYFPATEEKMPLLLNLMSSADVQRSIVFVNTKVAAERVTTRLERHGFRVGALSGDVPQKKRQKLLERFQRGEVDVLVATDVAARGLHIPAVSHVFNYDLPHDPEDYVHRIGRTARLGAEGDAISFACDLYAMGLPDIEQFIQQKIPVATVTRELLVPPARRERAEHPADAQNALDDEADALDAPPRPPRSRGDKPGRRSGGGGRSGGSGRSEGEKKREPQPASAAGESPVAAAGAGEGQPGEGQPAAAKRRRRRRGGRGGSRGNGGESGHGGNAGEGGESGNGGNTGEGVAAPEA